MLIYGCNITLSEKAFEIELLLNNCLDAGFRAVPLHVANLLLTSFSIQEPL